VNPITKRWLENMSESKKTTIAGIAIFISGGLQMLLASGVELPEQAHQLMAFLLLVAGVFTTQARDADKTSQDHHCRPEK
jgi:hypothetical protein